MSGGDAVTTHGISKRYGRETALDGVNLRVPEGAVYVLVEANGAGKSTTLKVLMNLERADAGTAEILSPCWSPCLKDRTGWMRCSPRGPHSSTSKRPSRLATEWWCGGRCRMSDSGRRPPCSGRAPAS